MDKLAKHISIISAILAVPIALFMAGMLVLALAMEIYGITSKWKVLDFVYFVCGAIYPVLAVLSRKKVQKQQSKKVALAWSLLPAPILLFLVVLTIGAFNN
jgi:uncharacterized membrane protein